MRPFKIYKLFIAAFSFTILAGCAHPEGIYVQNLCPEVKSHIESVDLAVYLNDKKSITRQERGLNPKSFMERLADVDITFVGGTPVAIYSPNNSVNQGKKLDIDAEASTDNLFAKLIKTQFTSKNWGNIKNILHVNGDTKDDRIAVFEVSESDAVMFVEYYYELVNSRSLYLNAKVALHPKKAKLGENYQIDAGISGQLKDNTTVYHKRLFVSSQMFPKDTPQQQAYKLLKADDYKLLRENMAKSLVDLSELISTNIESGQCPTA